MDNDSFKPAQGLQNITIAATFCISSLTFVLHCRFNFLNNFLAASERLDIWVVRFGDSAKYKYWGFSQMEQAEVDIIMHSMQVYSHLSELLSKLNVCLRDHHNQACPKHVSTWRLPENIKICCIAEHLAGGWG